MGGVLPAGKSERAAIPQSRHSRHDDKPGLLPSHRRARTNPTMRRASASGPIYADRSRQLEDGKARLTASRFFRVMRNGAETGPNGVAPQLRDATQRIADRIPGLIRGIGSANETSAQTATRT